MANSEDVLNEKERATNGIFFTDATDTKPEVWERLKRIQEEETEKAKKEAAQEKALIEKLHYQILKDGSVQYLNDAEQICFTDHGRYIEVDPSLQYDRETVIAMLMFAQEKFNGNIELTGTPEFKKFAIDIMIEENLKLNLKDPEQFALKEQLLKLRESELKNSEPDTTDKEAEEKNDTQVKTSQSLRVQVGNDPDSFTNVNAQAYRDVADIRGLTMDVEDLAATGLTARQIRDQLTKDGKLDFLDVTDRDNFIIGVRATLGIPSRSTEDGKAEFDVWLRDYQQRKGQTLEPNSQEKNSSVIESKIEVTPSNQGKLIDFGVAPYEHNPSARASFYVMLENENGRHTTWGVDLQRVIKQKNVELGDTIQLENKGAMPVVLPNGKEVKKNIWDIEIFEKNQNHVEQTLDYNNLEHEFDDLLMQTPPPEFHNDPNYQASLDADFDFLDQDYMQEGIEQVDPEIKVESQESLTQTTLETGKAELAQDSKHASEKQPESPQAYYTRDEVVIGQYALTRALELAEKPYSGEINANRLKEIHGYIFQDSLGNSTYSPGQFREDAENWTGRRVLKDSNFSPDRYLVHYLPSSKIDAKLNEVLSAVDIEALKTMDKDAAARSLAKLYSDLDFIHPFYEGNSRSIRFLTQEIADKAGLSINWSNTNSSNDARNELYIARDRAVLQRAFQEGVFNSESDARNASRFIHNTQNLKDMDAIMLDVVVSKAEALKSKKEETPKNNEVRFDSGYLDKPLAENDTSLMEYQVGKELKKFIPSDKPIAVLMLTPPGEYREQTKNQVLKEKGENIVYAHHGAFAEKPFYPLVKEHPATWTKALAQGAMAEKKNLMFHGNYHDSENLERAVRKLKQAGYRVEIKAIPVHEMVSALQDQTHVIKASVQPYSSEELKQRYEDFAKTVLHLQAVKGLIDRIEIVDPILQKSRVDVEYNATQDSWGKERAAVAEIIALMQHAPLTDQDLMAIENKIDSTIANVRTTKTPFTDQSIVALQHLRTDVERIEKNQDLDKEQQQTYQNNSATENPRPRPAP